MPIMSISSNIIDGGLHGQKEFGSDTCTKALGVSRQQLHRILAETAPITPEMALRIGKFCGNGPELWLRMQVTYDLWHARQAMAGTLDHIPTAKAKAA
jgi:addiction module HigA family antidote